MNKVFCPQCRSFDVEKEMTAMLVFGVPQKWKCNDCGYSNYVFPEIEEDKELNNKMIKNNK